MNAQSYFNPATSCGMAASTGLRCDEPVIWVSASVAAERARLSDNKIEVPRQRSALSFR
jgi:hypothetical protein